YSGGTTINSGATLDVTGAIEGPATVNGTFDVNNSFTIGDLTGGTSGAIILGSGDTLTVNNSANDTYAGGISSTGGLTIESSDSTTQTLSGMLSYKGLTTIDADGSLTLTGTGDKIGAVVDDGTLTIDPNVTITDLNGSGMLNLNGTDVLTVKTTMDDTFSGTLNGVSSTGLAVTGKAGGALALSGDLTGYTGSFNVSDEGVMDISVTANTPDTTSSGAYENIRNGRVNYWVNFDDTINFGSVHATLFTGNGNITSAQSASFSNSGYTYQQNLGEELSGSIF
ncbi:MAG TPA: hypothetical protein VKJ65_12185, partial [Phycisphaerae bacterium]|nr:hypothetical protein [Phycisphaerae bacterium]